MKKFLEQKIHHLAPRAIKKIRGEASSRTFFRVVLENNSLVAMVYPQENQVEIERIINFTNLYKEHGIPVPEIKDILEHRIILQEDLGDMLVQRYFRNIGKKEKHSVLESIIDILVKLAGIDTGNTNAKLGHDRMKWEMDFFIENFMSRFFPPAEKSDEKNSLQETLHAMVDKIEKINCFAHRDFHSRNMLYHKGQIYLVDYQDSLVASPYYDLVSFAYDAYLDLGNMREFLFAGYQSKGKGRIIDFDQLYLAALQRNIKALGTFGYQVFVKRNLAYKKYIQRTIRHITNNKMLTQLASRKDSPFKFLYKA